MQESFISESITPGCRTRAMPSAWASEARAGPIGCPLYVGASVPCWWLSDEGAAGEDADEIRRAHGCASRDSSALASSTADWATFKDTEYAQFFTAKFREYAGVGPPNGRCMTIFPPSWRMKDWCVASPCISRGISLCVLPHCRCCSLTAC